MLPFVQPTDAYGQISDNFLPETDYVDARVLAADTAESIAVPAGAKFCTLTADGEFYFNTRAAAAKPAADISNGSASRVGDPNGTNIIVTPADNISVIATGARIVTATFWGG